LIKIANELLKGTNIPERYIYFRFILKYKLISAKKIKKY